MSRPNPRVSIVMAVFNRVDEVPQALDGVAEQDYDNIELVVVDGASTDGTVDVLRQRSSEIDTLVSEPDKGIYDAWNKALQHVTGDWVLFLGSDDRYADPSAISSLVGAAQIDPDCNLVSGRAALLLPDGQVGAKIGSRWGKRRMKLCMTIAHPATLTRADLLRAHLPFSTQLGIAADYDLYLRAGPAVRAVDIDRIITHFSVNGVTSQETGKLLKATRRVQAANFGSLRATLQYQGFRIALPARQTLRALRSRRLRRAGQ